MPLMKSWVDSANASDTDFPLNNLPYGAFLTASGEQHCGVAIGDMILDVTALEADGVIEVTGEDEVFAAGNWTAFMGLGAQVWADVRATLTALLAEGTADADGLSR